MNLYLISFIITVIALVIFVVISDRKVLFFNASFFIFVLIANWGYYFFGRSETLEEALMAYRFVYVCGGLLTAFMMMLVFDACQIKAPKALRIGIYVFNSTVVALAMTMGYNNWFYVKSGCELVPASQSANGVAYFASKTYGPAHNAFYVMIYGYMIAGVVLLLVSLIRRKKLIYKNIFLMIFTYVITVLCYTVGKKIFVGFDPVPVSYAINAIFLIPITYNTSLYNLDEALLASVEKQEHHGYLLFDIHYKYVGCNPIAKRFIPEVDDQQLARTLKTDGSGALKYVDQLIRNFDGVSESEYLSYDGKDIEISIQYIYKNDRKRGYIVRIADDSKRQEYIRQLDLISTNKTNFLSNVSHEIRTPINAVLGMNEMILRESEEKKTREYATNIATSGQTLLQLINDVLDLSKIESGKMEVISTEYNLADIICNLEDMIRPLIKRDDLKLEVETAPNLPKRLYGDAVRVRQMATNILTNAVKYTESGTIRFMITGERDGDNFIFRYAVKDTGRGIKEGEMGNLFNAFERVDQVRNSGIEGTGLGLAITKKFANMMGGEIYVESEYGVGSTFTIEVPQKVIGDELMGDYRDSFKKTERKTYQESFHAPDAKVLVVDDVDMNLKVISLLLKKTQMQIVSCKSGRECIDLVQKEQFDLILLDHMMPELDGVETLKIMRENQYCDNTPVIALTANVDVDAEARYLAWGFNGYLAKPVQPAMLEDMLHKFLQDKVVTE